MEQLTLWDFSLKIEQAYQYHIKKITNHFKLSTIEVQIIFFLYNSDKDTAADISKYRKIAKSQISPAVHNLVNKGYLTRQRDEVDHKKIHLSLLPISNEIISYCLKEQKDMISYLSEDVSKEEVEDLENLLKKFALNLTKHY